MRGKFESENAQQSLTGEAGAGKLKEKVWAGSLHLGQEKNKKELKKKKKEAEKYLNYGSSKKKVSASKQRDSKLQDYFEEVGFEKALKLAPSSNIK